ncbi:Tobamovirus multiplication protein 2A [Citrus sinensis]|nr:Tobamovirus multiplication protein 2A [Citrus sinensis]
MACRGCLECLLKLLNFLLTIVGLAMVGYGIYLFVEYKRADNSGTVSPVSGDEGFVQLGRPMLMAVSLADSIFDKLPKAWFIYLFIGVGVVLFVISCVGCIGATTRNGCCLTCEIPADRTGDFNMIYDFLRENWNIVKWVALGVVILQNRFRMGRVDLTFRFALALIFLLAIIVRAANRPVEYDSDDELIAPRQQIRQPLINRPTPPATGVPVAGSLDQRPSRNDAWSTRMREKYGLDTSEFTYNPSESHRFQQVATQPAEERSRCTIM